MSVLLRIVRGVFIVSLFLLGMVAQADNDVPTVMLAGVQSRVTASDVTLTQFHTDPQRILSLIDTMLSTELAGDPRYAFYDTDETIARARMDEATLMQQLGNGQMVPSLQTDADYIIFGYLTNLSEVKAQTGALGLSGKDETVHLEISMRVMDAHTGAIVFATTADSRRKSKLIYHAIVQRNDVGEADAIREAASIAVQNLAAQFKRNL
ncbi:hypothetical protein [uncultured Megasphaera sp.]|uniref:hypothetical protein n=1 Tax=uncultured Megasphaera sp. TaxID=165188 RepID=UPI0025DF086A|nr:hypothetical protein [uncultured Megasphaera sp.]